MGPIDGDLLGFLALDDSLSWSGYAFCPGIQLEDGVASCLGAYTWFFVGDLRFDVFMDCEASGELQGISASSSAVLASTDANRGKYEGSDARVVSWGRFSPVYPTDASDPAVEYERLGGRDACKDEMDVVRLFLTDPSVPVLSDRTLACDSGLRNETVLDLRKARRLTFSLSSSPTDLLISGSLNSSLPCLSEAKYSSPLPKTTCNEAQSRVVPSFGFSHSLSAVGKS